METRSAFLVEILSLRSRMTGGGNGEGDSIAALQNDRGGIEAAGASPRPTEYRGRGDAVTDGL